MPWETIVDIARQVGEVSGRVDSLVSTTAELARTVASHDVADQERHVDLIKAGEKRHTATTKLLTDSHRDIMAAVQTLASRVEKVETVQSVPDAVAAVADPTVESARTLVEVLRATPPNVWFFSAAFIAAVISGVLGRPYNWPNPPGMDPPPAVVQPSLPGKSDSPPDAP